MKSGGMRKIWLDEKFKIYAAQILIKAASSKFYGAPDMNANDSIIFSIFFRSRIMICYGGAEVLPMIADGGGGYRDDSTPASWLSYFMDDAAVWRMILLPLGG